MNSIKISIEYTNYDAKNNKPDPTIHRLESYTVPIEDAKCKNCDFIDGCYNIGFAVQCANINFEVFTDEKALMFRKK